MHMNIGQRVVIDQQFVSGVCDGQNFGPSTVAELQALVGRQATIIAIARAGYTIAIDGLEGLFPVRPNEVTA